tara:strand:+ start:74877 stop:75185 length:309 start_codon:yes stop_codon:yes gene_type:complete
MGVAHKSMKMHTLLFLKGQRIKKDVHQKSFAPAHTAPEVQTLNGLLRFGLGTQDPGEKTFFGCGLYQIIKKTLQVINGLGLGWISANLTSAYRCGIDASRSF